MEKKPLLIAIIGPTAVGKTDLAIDLALELDTEIVSMDSRQVYREMTVGTAKPSKSQLQKVTHHFIDSHSVEDYFSAGAYERAALEKLDSLFKKHHTVVAVGGSGLYVRALCEGLDEMPEVDLEVRERLQRDFEQNGLEVLWFELEKNDPVYFRDVDLHNHQRVIRALEVIRATGKPFSHFREGIGSKADRPFEIQKIGLTMEREALNERIDRRMDQMIEGGLFEEAEKLYPQRKLNALQTVGYQEIFDFMDGKYDQEEAVRLLKRNSRRYAKRQMTWFNRDEEIKWFEAGTTKDKILESLRTQ